MQPDDLPTPRPSAPSEPTEPRPADGESGVLRSAAGRQIPLAVVGGGSATRLTSADAVGRLPAGSRSEIRGVYAHVPFCFHKCHYCDFYSFVDAADRQPAYVRRLDREIAAAVDLGVFTRPLETLFVGGGTPTLLRPPLLREALGSLRTRLPFAAGYEWTVEANPETVTDEVAAVLVESGVNRVSLGAQSFHPAHLKTLERWHDPASVARAVGHLRRAGIARINIDLIFGIPGSTLEEWSEDLERALAIGPDHLSCYGLTYEPNTAMSKRLELGQFEPCDEDLEAAMYERTVERTEAAGFAQYEISNYATPGQACRHNLLYWRNADWWSFGPSASAHVQGIRWKNVPRITDWLESEGTSPIVDLEQVDAETRAGEILLVGLRLIEGLDEATVAACCSGPRGAERRATLDSAIARGWLDAREGRVRFTKAGMLLADEVLAELV